MESVKLASLIKDVNDVYSLPDIYYKIDSVINDPRASTSKIGAIISEDTGLSARLLRLANSAYFNFPAKVDSISKAVSIIGTRQLRDLVLATSVIEAFGGIPQNIVDMKSFWHHSISCGLTARIIGIEIREQNVETFFVAGLLHDIGSLIIYSKLSEIAQNLINTCQEKQALKHDVELQVLGFNHADVGGALLKEWKLPSSLCHSVHYHHHPAKLGSNSRENIVDAVHIADFLVHALQMGNSGSVMVPSVESSSWDRLKLNENSLGKMVTLLDEQFQEVSEIILG